MFQQFVYIYDHTRISIFFFLSQSVWVNSNFGTKYIPLEAQFIKKGSTQKETLTRIFFFKVPSKYSYAMHYQFVVCTPLLEIAICVGPTSQSSQIANVIITGSDQPIRIICLWTDRSVYLDCWKKPPQQWTVLNQEKSTFQPAKWRTIPSLRKPPNLVYWVSFAIDL